MLQQHTVTVVCSACRTSLIYFQGGGGRGWKETNFLFKKRQKVAATGVCFHGAKTTWVGLCLPNPSIPHPSAHLFISLHHWNSKWVPVSVPQLVHLLPLSVMLLSSSTSQLSCFAPRKWRLQKKQLTFIPPAEDTPVNSFLRRHSSLNNKRAEQTRPFTPGEDGASANPPGHTSGVCYTAAGHVHISNLCKIINRFHTDPPQKKSWKKKQHLCLIFTQHLLAGSAKNIFFAPPSDTRTESTPPTRGRLSESVKAAHTSSLSALSRLPTDVASFAPLRTKRCRSPLLIRSVDGGDGSQITAGRYTPLLLSLWPWKEPSQWRRSTVGTPDQTHPAPFHHSGFLNNCCGPFCVYACVSVSVCVRFQCRLENVFPVDHSKIIR